MDKNGEEWYQITIGGRQGNLAAIGKILGPSVSRAQIPDVVERLIEAYLDLRLSAEERFVETVARLGNERFKAAAYMTINGTTNNTTTSTTHAATN